MCIYANLHKQEGSVLAVVLLFSVALSFILLSGLELHLRQIQATQLFYHKVLLLNQVEARVKKSASDALSLANTALVLDHQDSCGNQYYLVEASASDVLAKAHIKIGLIGPKLNPTKICEAPQSKLIYQEMS